MMVVLFSTTKRRSVYHLSVCAAVGLGCIWIGKLALCPFTEFFLVASFTSTPSKQPSLIPSTLLLNFTPVPLYCFVSYRRKKFHCRLENECLLKNFRKARHQLKPQHCGEGCSSGGSAGYRVIKRMAVQS